MKLKCTRRGCNNTKDFFIKEAYYCGGARSVLMPQCKCGCGESTSGKYNSHTGQYALFVNGHNTKGKQHSEEHKRKIGLSKLGKKRPDVSEARKGDRNPMWKGDSVGNGSLHRWVRNHLRCPSLCEGCRENPVHDLANITGIYSRDLTNWKYLCRRCHMRSDGRMNNLKQFRCGHIMEWIDKQGKTYPTYKTYGSDKGIA